LPAIHQFHPAASSGDAVTRSLLLTQELLRDLGFASEIYVDRVDASCGDRLRPLRDYPAARDNLLLVHHSIGHELVDWVLGLPDRKLLVYHNITPPEFFPDDPYFRRWVELGRDQLAQLRPAMVGALCDSPFNAEELVATGYQNIRVLPLLVVTERLRDTPWSAGIVEENAGVFTLLFVGRVERNKCQHDIVEVFRLVDRWLGRRAQCVLVGKPNPCVAYIHELRQLTAALGIADRVRLVGHVPDEELHGWYRAADVFLSMSEHEGFGVPLIEAMAFDVPVIAHASSSVPHTLGGAAVLFEGKPHGEIAALICRLGEDGDLRQRIIERQRQRSAVFTFAALRTQLAVVLAGVGVTVPEVCGRALGVEGEPSPRDLAVIDQRA